jgi:hypothetical protein
MFRKPWKNHGNLGENHGKQSWNWHKTCG